MRTFVNIGYLTKVNIDNLNSSESSGNLIVLKRVQDRKGDYYAYVSGQALRHYLKETMNQLGMKLTKTDSDGTPVYDEQIIPIKEKALKIAKKYRNKKKPEEYFRDVFNFINSILKSHPDLDLFGFLDPDENLQARRWSPVKVSPMISIYPWKGDTDMLTRKKEGQEGGDLVKVEINTFNFMRGTVVVDINMIGSRVDELSYEMEETIPKDIKAERIEYLADAIKNLDGGAKKARLLEDLTPKFVIVTKQKAGTPIFLNALDVDSEGNIKTDLIKEILEEFDEIIGDYRIGLRSGIFKNEDKLKTEFGDKLISVNKALDKIKTWSNGSS